MRIKYLFINILLGLLIIPFISRAQFDSTVSITGGLNALRVAVPFLTISPDSRAGAMGDVGAASSPDVNSQHWNPAKFPFIEGKEWGVSLSYTPWLRNLVNDINLTNLTGYYKLDNMQVISGSLLYFSMGEVTFTNSIGEQVKMFNPNEFALDFGYSRKFSDHIGGAMVFRYIRSDLTGGYSTEGTAKAGTSFAADVAMYYQSPIQLNGKNGEMAFGLNISNIGAKLSYNDDPNKDFIPINMRLGGRISMDIDNYNNVSFMLDANKLLVPTPPIYDQNNEIVKGMDPNVAVVQGMVQSFYDAPGGLKEELQEIYYSTGVEYWYAKQFALRAGYFYENKNKGNRKYLTLGAGLRYNVFNIDFAYLIPAAGFNSPMANTVRFSLSFDFDSATTKRKK
ncbi:MAG: type IX secretion system outer membrane channel protein PorV [Bacteroidales bacterium]|nr:type IX secretion system outer membrane channel protein PorV [Bacteroidales bacterium]HPD95213.1 type IX secretion system outer membrane channel protein PorV [Tenuifilaceae bacterium]HRX31489.1 type IX secretion system outer membrane channel protein PorV [Tenuifilaceae bacterium]